ncbi:MAG: DedA family protein [Desulfuromonadales bacterium]|jgi:membrane protein DedA with SNARE-associated domain
MEALIGQFGYLAILVGTFLEGETVLALGGFAAHRGYLDLAKVIVCGFLGTFIGDQLFYQIGRRHSDARFFQKPGRQARVEKAQALIKKHRLLIILGFRFLYGMRTVTPFAIGIAGISPRLFIPLNLLGAVVWSLAVGWAGYFFGQALEGFFGELKRVEVWIMLAIAVTGGLIWWIHRLRSQQ